MESALDWVLLLMTYFKTFCGCSPEPGNVITWKSTAVVIVFLLQVEVM